MYNPISIDADTKLGTLVTYFPEITKKLNELHIDYCCQGDHTLGETVETHQLSDTFIDGIKRDYQAWLDRPSKKESVAGLSNKELIDLIIEVHHVPERALWDEITPMLNKILIVHYEHGSALLLTLHHEFSLLRMELEEHFAKEECEVFPLILQANQSGADKAEILDKIYMLESEHEAAGDIIKRIQKLTDDFTPPDYACNTFKAVYAKLHQLIDDIFLHIAKENSVLFKRFE